MSSALVITNKYSGTKLAGDIYRGTIFHILHKRGIMHEVIHCHDGQGIVKSERAVGLMKARDWSCVVVIAGDGTVHEAVNSMVEAGIHRRTPLLVVPAGRMNSLASSIKMTSVDAAVDTLRDYFAAKSRTVRMPLWEMTEPIRGRKALFHGFFGVGWHAASLREAALLTDWWSHFAVMPGLKHPYFWASLRQAWLAKSFPMKIFYENTQGVDMELSGEYSYLHATQLRMNGMKNIVSPNASLDARLLWVTAAPPMGIRQSLRFGGSMSTGKHVDMEGVHYFAAKSLSVLVERPHEESGLVGDSTAMLDGFPMHPAEAMGCVRITPSSHEITVLCPSG